MQNYLQNNVTAYAPSGASTANWIELGLNLSMFGRHADAIGCFDRALDADFGNQDARAYKQMCLEKLKNPDTCNHFECDTEYADMAYIKGVVLSEIGDYAGALECFDKAIGYDSDFISAFYHKGLTLVKINRHQEAIGCFDAAIALSPADVEMLHDKGAALIKTGRHEEAIKCYDMAIELKADDLYAWLKKGHALHKCSNYQQAIRCYDRALAIDNRSLMAWHLRGLALHEQGVASCVTHKFEEALKCFRNALEIDPRDVDVMSDRAKTLVSLGRQEEAMACLDKIIEIDKLNDQAWAAKGDILKRFPDSIRRCNAMTGRLPSIR